MSLTDQQIRALSFPGKHADGNGLTLLVMPNGSKLWRFRFRHAGREGMVSLGAYPQVSLKQARTKALAARVQVATGENPSEARQAAKAAGANSFAAAARDYMERRARKLDPATLYRDQNILDRYVLPVIGGKSFAELGVPDLTACLRRMEKAGRTDSVARARGMIYRIFRSAIADGLTKHNTAADVDPLAFERVKVKHHPGLTNPRKVGELLSAIEEYRGRGSSSVRNALRLVPHIALRSRELRNIEVGWIDWDRDELRIPAHVMKMDKFHVVPLSKQAQKILREANEDASGGFVFPSLKPGKVISENTLNQALRSLGYDTRTVHCLHGFRTTFSTLLNERGENSDLIELQLAHCERDEVRAAYNQAQRVEARREMMQRWSDYLTALIFPFPGT